MQHQFNALRSKTQKGTKIPNQNPVATNKSSNFEALNKKKSKIASAHFSVQRTKHRFEDRHPNLHATEPLTRKHKTLTLNRKNENYLPNRASNLEISGEKEASEG